MKNEEGGGILEGIFNFFFLNIAWFVAHTFLAPGFSSVFCVFFPIEYLRSPLCVKCGRPLPSSSALLCHHCRAFSFHFDSARAVALYTSPFRECIHAFKYQGFTSFRSLFGELLCEYLEKNPFLREVDFLLPVPLHPARFIERGFNQSLILAEEIKNAFPFLLCLKKSGELNLLYPRWAYASGKEERTCEGLLR